MGRGGGRPRGGPRYGETRQMTAELHLHDYRFLLWWGLTREQARRRLKINWGIASALNAMIDEDPRLDPERWAQDMIRAEDCCDAELTRVS